MAKPPTADCANSGDSALKAITAGSDILLIPGSIARLNEQGTTENTLLAVSDGETLIEYSKRYDGGDTIYANEKKLLWSKGIEEGYFPWRDYSVGVEICADHGSLKDRDKCTDLDLQIVISCGMTLSWNSLAIHEGGLAFLCDGAEPKQVLQPYPLVMSSLNKESVPDEEAVISENVNLMSYTTPAPTRPEMKEADGEDRSLWQPLRRGGT